MLRILREIDDFFGGEGIPADETGCLHSVGQFLQDLDVSLLILADDSGRLIAVHDMGPARDPAEVRRVANQIVEGLAQEPLCVFPHTTESDRNTGFGLRLPADAENGILGGLCAMSDSVEQRLETMRSTLTTLGSLARYGIDVSKRAAVQAIRIDHLRAEQDTLKHTHSYAVATVVEEREERIREQRDYALHLEEEVAKRSVALREAMKKAQEANKAKSTFLANMSHEIRTPMTAILGYADVLFDSGNLEQDPALRSEAIDTIRRNGKFLLDLINDVLDIAKVEAGQLAVEHVACSPVEILNDVITLMRLRAQTKNLELNVEYDGPIPAIIYTDPTRLRQILVNLVGNAIKFTEEGRVSVIARVNIATDENAQMQFDVIDTGIGLSKLQMPKLFKPFSQADTSTARRYGGTGLGLALSQRLAHELGGEISVTSRFGEGSTFKVLVATGPLGDVPMLDDPAAALPHEGVPTSVGTADVRLEGRILLAEDCLDNQKLITLVLTRAGAQVVAARNGREAVDEALASSFDVILMDMQMPVLDGYGATKELRRRGYTKPIIALTANVMSGDEQVCIDAGCDDFVGKPIDRAKLLPLVAAHIENSRLTKPVADNP